MEGFPSRQFNLNACLELLLDFDRRVNDNKTAAEEALRRIPAINRTIAEANEKTREAQLALGNAAADATEAKNKAHEAERIASGVQKVSASVFSSPCSHITHRTLWNHPRLFLFFAILMRICNTLKKENQEEDFLVLTWDLSCEKGGS